MDAAGGAEEVNPKKYHGQVEQNDVAVAQNDDATEGGV
jgi:hypothetical protein